MFDLRAALEQPGLDRTATLYYRAITSSRFGRETEAMGQLREYLATHPGPAMERRAHQELASALVRTGEYRQAESEWAAALALTSDGERPVDENKRVLLASLSDVAPQTVEFGSPVPIQASRNAISSWNVPVEIGGHHAEWIFDTGANFSTVSESEARRMGLTIREANAYATGSTGKNNSLRLAVAPDLLFGAAHLRNVVFLVLPDQSLYLVPVKFQIQGILGLPAIRALRCLEFSARGVVTLKPGASSPEGSPNLFFSELNLIVGTFHAHHGMQMVLDTGFNATVLYPSFRGALGNDELARLKPERQEFGGAGGVVQRTTYVVPALRLEVLGQAVELHSIRMFGETSAGGARLDGVLGMDALERGFGLDFTAMRLTLK